MKASGNIETNVSEAGTDTISSLSGDGAAYRASLVSRLKPSQKSTVERMKDVKNTHIRSGRDKYLNELLDQLLIHALTEKDGRPDDGRVLFITGESGAGKSHAILHMLKNHPSLQPRETSIGTIKPFISVSLRGPGTLKTLGCEILEAAGYPIERNTKQGELWSMLPNQLKLRGVLLVHIDETQHMLRQTEKDRERKNLANTLKSVMNDPHWPVSLIMSGLPQTTELASLDEQFERRGTFAQLPDLEMRTDRKLVVKALMELASKAQLDASDIMSSDIPDRIARAVNYRFGRTISLIIAAIQVALSHEVETLENVHFAEAYVQRSHVKGHNEMNFFVTRDWEQLQPGSFLYK